MGFPPGYNALMRTLGTRTHPSQFDRCNTTWVTPPYYNTTVVASLSEALWLKRSTSKPPPTRVPRSLEPQTDNTVVTRTTNIKGRRTHHLPPHAGASLKRANLDPMARRVQREHPRLPDEIFPVEEAADKDIETLLTTMGAAALQGTLRCCPYLIMAGLRAAERPPLMFPGRPEWLLSLLFLLSHGLPRQDLPVVLLLLVVPVLRSVRRLLNAPLFLMHVLPHRAAAPLLPVLRDALFAPLCLYLPCGSWASIVRATCASATRAARRPLAIRPGCGGAGAAVRRATSAHASGWRAARAAACSWEAAGAGQRTVLVVALATTCGYRATIVVLLLPLLMLMLVMVVLRLLVGC
jgi:hypothetical protein